MTRPRLTLAGLALAVLTAPIRADDPPPKPAGNAWTFEEAVNRLALAPRDPYLQYVVLQLGRRDGREREAAQAVERPGILGNFGMGRQSRVDLFGTFTGALAVQESLQLDTMRGDQPGGVGRPARPGTPPPPQPPRPPGPVKVETLIGPSQPSHPWEKLLAGRTPDIGPLAGLVPQEYYFAEFKSVARLHETLGTGQLWAGHVFTQVLGGGGAQGTAARIKAQLGLGTLPPEQYDKLGVEAVAVVGSDPFLTEGSDVTLLVKGKTVATLGGLLDASATGKGEHVGIAYSARTAPDRSIHVYTATPRPDLHVRGNSLPAFERVLECVAGKTADGKPAGRLGETAEFRYVRTRMPRGAAEEDGFVFLSDGFIRRLTGPQLKLTERRRVLVYNHLRMIGHAALLFRTEHGRPPKSLEELARAGCAPGVFGEDDLTHPDGGTYSLTGDGMSGVCSKYGRAEFLTPCIERPLAEVSADEAAQYQRFVTEYSRYWRTFFDPIAVRVSLTPTHYRLETLVLPLIENTIYTELARGAGKPAAMDLLPTPAREVGGLWVHLPKKPLLDALAEYEAKKPPPDPNAAARPAGPVDAVQRAAARAQRQNDLKQIGLAFHNHHDITLKLPDDIKGPDGKPLLSWRVAILPYIEQDNLYKEFKLDEPWDSGHNKKLLAKMPRIYAGPDEKLNAAGKTAYLGLNGRGTLFAADAPKWTIATVADGTSNTVLAVVADPAAAVEWTKPDDLPFDPKDPLKGVVRPGAEGVDVLMLDGSTKRLSPRIAPATFTALATPAGGETIAFAPGDELPGPADDPVVSMFFREVVFSADTLRGLESAGVDPGKLRRFLADGIGDQVGFHMHDAPRLIDSDLSGLFGIGGGEDLENLAGVIGLVGRFVLGPSSVSVPVKDPKVVDEYLAELDRLFLAQRQTAVGFGLRWGREVDFYKTTLAGGHTIRVVTVNLFGLKWRVYWGRIGDGLYVVTRPFIL